MADMNTRIQVQGLNEFRTAMASAARAVKETVSAEKLAEQQYRATGNAQAFQQAKLTALQQKLEAQKTAVEAARQACERLEKAGVAPDDARLVSWRTKLNQAQAALTATQTEMNQVTESANKMGDAAKASGEKFDFKSATMALHNVDQAMSSVISKASQLGQSIWQTAVASSEWADSLLTTSTQTGIDTETLQAWEYAAKFVDTEVSTITNARAKIVKAMADGPIDIGGTIISTEGRGWEDVFWDVTDALGSMRDESARDQAAMEIFGKSFADLIPLISAGRETWEAYGEEARENGVVLSEDQVAALGQFNDSLQRMNSSTEALGNTLMAALAPGLETISDAVAGVAAQFSAWLQSEEGKAALQDLSNAIANVVSSLSGGALSTAVQAITTAFKSLGAAVTYVSEHTGGIIAFLGMLGATKAANTMLSIAESIKQIGLVLGGGLSNPWVLAVMGVVAGCVAVSSLLDDMTDRTNEMAEQMAHMRATVNEVDTSEITEEIEQATAAADVVKEIKVKIHATYDEGRSKLDEATEDGVVTEEEAGMLTQWVHDTIDPDLERAEQYCADKWAQVYRAATTPPQMRNKVQTVRQVTTLTIMSMWVGEAMGEDAKEATATAQGMWDHLADVAGGRNALMAQFAGLPEGEVYDAMVDYIMATMGVDKPTAEAQAQLLWQGLQAAASSPDTSLDDPYDPASGEVNVTASQIMSHWVEAVMAGDADEATRLAGQYWQTVIDAVSGKNGGASQQDANDQAEESVRNSRIYETMTELQNVRNQLDTAIAEIQRAGNNATEEQIRQVETLMGYAEQLQTRLNILMSDAMQLGEGAFNAVKNGQAREGDLGKAVEYINTLYEMDTEAAAFALEQANQARLEAERNGTPQEAEAARAAYDTAVQDYNAALADADLTRMQQFNDLLLGQAQAKGIPAEAITKMETYADALERLMSTTGPDMTVEDWQGMLGLVGDDVTYAGMQVNKMTPEQIANYLMPGGSEFAGAGGAIYDLIKSSILGSYQESLEGGEGFLAIFQGMLDSGTFEGLDWTKATGPMAAGIKTALLADEDFNSSAYEGVGTNVTQGMVAGITAGTPEAVAAAKAMAEAVNQAIRETLDINSPSKVTEGLGEFVGMGFAQGIDASVASVSTAARGLAIAAGAPVARAAAGSVTGGDTISNSAALYIGTYNQGSDADQDSLLAKIDALQREQRMGYGSRR